MDFKKIIEEKLLERKIEWSRCNAVNFILGSSTASNITTLSSIINNQKPVPKNLIEKYEKKLGVKQEEILEHNNQIRIQHIHKKKEERLFSETELLEMSKIAKISGKSLSIKELTEILDSV